MTENKVFWDFYKKLAPEERERFVRHFAGFIQEDRFEKLQKVASQRTDHLCLVLEDLYKSQNTSAIFRSCECMGIQHLHIFENFHDLNLCPDIAVGSDKWLSIHRYRQEENHSISGIYQKLREEGYKIVATSPNIKAVSLQELDIRQPVAIVFGTEKQGLSQEAIEAADEHMYIPMRGFTESFNVSVSVAITLHYLTEKLHQSSDYPLKPEDYDALLLQWTLSSQRYGKESMNLWLKENHYPDHIQYL